MKVVLATLNAKYIHTSLAIRLLKAYSQHEFDITLAEYTIKDPAMNIVSDLFKKAPDVIGFSVYIWNIEETLKLIEILKKVMPGVTIVLGGPEVSYEPLYFMNRERGIDFIVCGDGEETFHHLLQELRDEKRFHFVFGAAYRKGEEVAVNPPRPKSDLNTLPTPHRFPEDLPDLSKRIVYFETSRGCPFNCQFCLSSIEVGVRYYDIERVKSDLLYLISNGAKTIKFLDRTFNINRSYALEMFRFLIDNHGGCVFQFEITADIMRPEVLDFLAEHAPPGIFRFEIGVQSTNDETNELVKRRQNFAKLSRTVMKIKESGKIDQHLDLIAGLPMEDYATFRRTFNDVFAMEPEELQLGFLKMLRGTGLRAQAAKYNYVYMEHAPYEILSSHVMPFPDIIRLKRLEDVLEKYWNAHRMDHTMKYLLRYVFKSPFDFFQEFGDYWEERGWQRIGHQLEDLFTRLNEFLLQRGTPGMDVISGLMKLDYYLGHKYKPRKIWWEPALSKNEWGRELRVIAERPERLGEPLFEAAAKAEAALGKAPGAAGSAAAGAAGAADAADASGAGRTAAQAAGSIAEGTAGSAAAGAPAAAFADEPGPGSPPAASDRLRPALPPERELQKFAALELLPFPLAEVLASLGGTPAADPAVTSGTAGAMGGRPQGRAAEGTLLLVLYQQDESGRPAVYGLPAPGKAASAPEAKAE